MAIQSLLETTPEENIIDLGNEEGRPQFIFPKDDTYGIAGGYGDYALKECRLAGRKIKDGKYKGNVERYKRWEDVNYSGTFWGAVNNYVKYKVLSEFKTKKINKDLQIDDIKGIYIEILEIIRDAMKSNITYKDIKEVCDLYDEKTTLLSEIEELKKQIGQCEKYMQQIEQYHNDIKEKRKIIVDVDKPKKRKIKEETE